MKETIQELRNKISNLMNENLTQEQLKQFGDIGSTIDKLEAEDKAQSEKYSSLQTDYINMVKGYSFKADEQSMKSKANENAEPKSFEDIVQDILDKREKK